MKQRLFLLLAVVAFGLSSCSKSNADYLQSGTWNCTSYKVENNEFVGVYLESLKVNFNEGGSVSGTVVVSGTSVPVSGTWNVSEDNNTFSMSTTGLTITNLPIIELDENKLHLKGTQDMSGNNVQVELIFTK